MPGIIERMIEIGYDNNYSISALEKECEMTRGVLNQAIKRGSSINTFNFELFVDKLSVITKGRQINYEYLLTGKLPKYLNTYYSVENNKTVKECSSQQDFEEQFEVALDNQDIQKKLREIVLLSQ